MLLIWNYIEYIDGL